MMISNYLSPPPPPLCQVHFHLVNRRTGELWPAVYTCEPFFFFHVVNAHQLEQGDGYLVVDVVAYRDAEILSNLKFSHIERTDHVQHARPIRVSLPLRSAMVSWDYPTGLLFFFFLLLLFG